MNRFSYFWLGVSICLLGPPDAGAHVLEPLGTEIPTTVPKGLLFGQIEYSFQVSDSRTEGRVPAHFIPMEFEIGVGNRTQINLEAEILLKENPDPPLKNKSGIEELAFGLKNRFWDETPSLPASAFLLEYAPAAGLEGNHTELKASLLFSKTTGNRTQVYLAAGYLLETERETGPAGTEVENFQRFLYHLAPAFTIVPHHIVGLLELIGETDFKNARTEAVLMPEIIFGSETSGLKLGFPLGLTGESADYGIRIGLSRFFD